MNLFQMAYSISFQLLLVGFLLALSIQAQPTKDLMPFSDGVTEDILYDIKMGYKDFSFSGLFALKSEGDNYHIYIITKTGLILMEAILKEYQTEWIKTFPLLDKKSRKNKINTDLRLITQCPLKFGSVIKETKSGMKIKLSNGKKAFFSVENGEIVSAETRGFLKIMKTKVKYQTTLGLALPQSIITTKSFLHTELILELHGN